MVRLPALALFALATPGLAAVDGPARGPDPARAVGSAMGKGSYPWYDAPRDAIRPTQVPAGRDDRRSSPPSSSTSTPGTPSSGLDFGNIAATVAFAAALAALIGLLIWFWRIYEPSADAEGVDDRKARGEADRIEELPAGLRLGYDPSDAWAEAIRRRDRGDLAGAIVCLFAHQLMTLSRLGLVRLAPGKTGRQLVRAVADAEFRGLVAPTLRLFEVAYYGHRDPSDEEFAAAWSQAEAFERRAAAGVAP